MRRETISRRKKSGGLSMNKNNRTALIVNNPSRTGTSDKCKMKFKKQWNLWIQKPNKYHNTSIEYKMFTAVNSKTWKKRLEIIGRK